MSEADVERVREVQRVMAALSKAQVHNRGRVVLLNAVARGDLVLTEVERHWLVSWEKEVARLLSELHTESGVTRRMRVVSDEEVSRGREALPSSLREQYELLFCRAYGSDPAVSVGDSSVIRGVGKPQSRVNSGSSEKVPGARTNGKKAGANTRSIVKDGRAYELKLRVDRRLRRLAREIRDELADEQRGRTIRVCTRCARIGEEEWGWCPHCGHEMKTEEQ